MMAHYVDRAVSFTGRMANRRLETSLPLRKSGASGQREGHKPSTLAEIPPG